MFNWYLLHFLTPVLLSLFFRILSSLFVFYSNSSPNAIQTCGGYETTASIISINTSRSVQRTRPIVTMQFCSSLILKRKLSFFAIDVFETGQHYLSESQVVSFQALTVQTQKVLMLRNSICCSDIFIIHTCLCFIFTFHLNLIFRLRRTPKKPISQFIPYLV